jgi:hypothetical protein
VGRDLTFVDGRDEISEGIGGLSAVHRHAACVLVGEVSAAVEMGVEEDLHGAALFAALAEGLLELHAVDLEVLATGARVTFWVDRVVLVGQVLELDRPIAEQGVGERAFNVAAGLFVPRVGGASCALDLFDHAAGEPQISIDPRGLARRYHVYFFSHFIGWK